MPYNVKRLVSVAIVAILSCAVSIIFGLLTAALVTLRMRASLQKLEENIDFANLTFCPSSIPILQALATSSALTFLPILFGTGYLYRNRVIKLLAAMG